MAEEKYHIGPDGPKKCTASIKACPVGGLHFKDVQVAQQAYEQSMEAQLMPQAASKKAAASKPRPLDLKKKQVNIPQSSSYYGRPYSVTLQDYREHLQDLQERYPHAGSELTTEALSERLGLEELTTPEDAYSFSNVSLEAQPDGTVKIHESLGGRISWGYIDGPEDYYDPADYYNPAIGNYPGVEDSELKVQGYYGDESEMVYTYRPQNEVVRKSIAEEVEAVDASKAMARMNNKHLPEWAVLPTTAKVEEGQKYTREETIVPPGAKDRMLRVPKPVSIPAPASTAKLDKLLDPEASARKSETLVKRKAKAVEELNNSIVQNEAKAQEVARDVSITPRAKKIALNKLAQQRNILQRNLQREEQNLASAEKQLKVFQAASSPEALAKAKEEKARVIAASQQRRKEATIKKLSQHYPSVHEAVRLSEASKWVEAHPALVDEEW